MQRSLIVTLTGNLLIVFVYFFVGGSLLSYLRATSPISLRRKIEICADVARALVYLQYSKCIHRYVPPVSIDTQLGAIARRDNLLYELGQRQDAGLSKHLLGIP